MFSPSFVQFQNNDLKFELWCEHKSYFSIAKFYFIFLWLGIFYAWINFELNTSSHENIECEGIYKSFAPTNILFQ
jgi:hypothetical protein